MGSDDSTVLLPSTERPESVLVSPEEAGLTVAVGSFEFVLLRSLLMLLKADMVAAAAAAAVVVSKAAVIRYGKQRKQRAEGTP